MDKVCPARAHAATCITYQLNPEQKNRFSSCLFQQIDWWTKNKLAKFALASSVVRVNSARHRDILRSEHRATIRQQFCWESSKSSTATPDLSPTRVPTCQQGRVSTVTDATVESVQLWCGNGKVPGGSGYRLHLQLRMHIGSYYGTGSEGRGKGSSFRSMERGKGTLHLDAQLLTVAVDES